MSEAEGMNVIQEINGINHEELRRGIVGGEAGSWHQQYRESSYVYVGGLSYELSEGDVLCVFSQWGEIEDINLVRDEATGNSKGFAFVKFEDQRSTVLAVDNFNGAKLLGRVIRVDHVSHYKLPRYLKEKEEKSGREPSSEAGYYCSEQPVHGSDSPNIYQPGHAYQEKVLANEFDIANGVDLYTKVRPGSSHVAQSSDAHDGGEHSDVSLVRARKRSTKEKKKTAKKERKKSRKSAKGEAWDSTKKN